MKPHNGFRDLIIEWLRSSAQQEGYKYDQVDYIFSNDEFILELNQQFLDHHYYTDILTFPMNESASEAEIYISLDRVLENSGIQKCSFETELARVMIHGILHLAGYMDGTIEEKELMRKKENFYLDKLDLKIQA